jgi:short subunit dehydrogenase-like uncharacterized protein
VSTQNGKFWSPLQILPYSIIMAAPVNKGTIKSMKDQWILYGAYGFTGQLIAEEAVRRGLTPILAGRDREKLISLGEKLGLVTRVVSLTHSRELGQAIQDAAAVLHAAGPYTQTAAPMQAACLEKGCHYLDITGEVPVFENTFALHERAFQAGTAFISGVGFDVIPSDCLAVYTARQLPEAVRLETAVAAVGRASAGTVKSGMEMFAHGNLIRQNGTLVEIPFGIGQKQLAFADRSRTVMPASWGDLSTAYRSTGIPNITCYLAVPRSSLRWLKRLGWLAPKLFSNRLARRLLQAGAERFVQGPDEAVRSSARSHLWARVEDGRGHTIEAWLETAEAYHFTAQAAVRCLEKVLAGEVPSGSFSPAQAFGADFVLQIPGTILYDHIPNPQPG